MDTRLISNIAQVIAKMKARPDAVISSLSSAAKRLAPQVGGEARRIMQDEIYNIPIPLKRSLEKKTSRAAAIRSKTTKGKKGQWMRTGELKRAETATSEGPTIILRNNKAYARHRHSLGTPGHRQIRTPGVRSVQWQPKAIANKSKEIAEARRRAILQALRQ